MTDVSASTTGDDEANGVVILAGAGDSTRIVYHALKSEFAILAVIVERRPSRRVFLRNRIRRLGLREVAGQLAFQAGVIPLLRHLGSARAAQIRRQYGLDTNPIDEAVTREVSSANGDETIQLLRDLRPRVVIVNGTRILSKRVLGSVVAPIINMHAGITPLFRGVHGGYWSLAEHRPEHCGVTVHLVDPGVDTGDVLGQALIEPTRDDNFTTYPLLQLAAGLPLLKRAVRDALDGTLRSVSGPAGASRQWYHPTLWGYLRRLYAEGLR